MYPLFHGIEPFSHNIPQPNMLGKLPITKKQKTYQGRDYLRFNRRGFFREIGQDGPLALVRAGGLLAAPALCARQARAFDVMGLAAQLSLVWHRLGV